MDITLQVAQAMTRSQRAKVAKHARSARLAAARSNGTHSRAEWLEMLAFYGQCVRCGSDKDIKKDHIVPIFYEDASDSISNIQPLCGFCNASKGPEDTDHRQTHPKGCPFKWIQRPRFVTTASRYL